MKSLDVLLSEVRACTLCHTYLPEGPRPVLQADCEARILIAGQAPGRRVHQTGVPFDDPSGTRLRSWLGVARETFYDPKKIAILPMAFCYPGTGKSGDLPPRPECAPAWRAPLLEHLHAVKLTLILGRWALEYHQPKTHKTVTEAVHAWRSTWPEQLVLPHPSPRNQAWLKRNQWFERDLIPRLQARVREVLGS